MTNAPCADDWESLMERMSLDQLSEAEWSSVVARLAMDEEACERYIETIYLREGLPYLLANLPTDASPTDLDDGAMTKVRLPPSMAEAMREWAPATTVTPPEAPVAATRRSWPSWVQIACVMYAFGALSAWGVFRRNVATDVVGAPPPVRRLTQSALRNLSTAAEHQPGQITGLSPDAASPGVLRSMHVGQELRCGEVVQISTGHIRVALRSGLEVLFTGPAEFSLMDPRTVFVRVGRLAASGAGSFEIQTPLLTAECKGASASFEVTDNEAAGVAVDSGTVALLSTPQEGVVGVKLRVLSAGEGVFAESDGEAGRIAVLAGPPLARIVKTWNDVEQGYTAYERLVLSSEPVAYWPLRHVRRNCRVLDLTQNGHDGVAIGKWSLENGDAAPVLERGAYFDGESYVEAEHKPVIDPRHGFTVEGWAKVAGEPAMQAMFASRWVLKSLEPDCQHFGITLYASELNHWEYWTGSGAKGDHWQRLVSNEAIARGEWTYVAATFEPTGPEAADGVPGRVQLFANGRRLGEDVHRGWVTEFEWPARIGAAEYVPRFLTSWLFRGHMSDVALYDHALSSERILRHFEMGRAQNENQFSAQPLLPWQGNGENVGG